MTIAQLRTKMDNLLNEGSVSRFASTTQVNDFLNSAQNQTITRLITKFYQSRNHALILEYLSELVTLDTLNTTTVGATLQEYTLPTDFLYSYKAKYCNNNTHNLKDTTYLPFFDSVTRTKNRFSAPMYDSTGLCLNPTHYIRNKKLGFFPQPSGAGGNNYEHFYIKKPVAVSGSDLTNLTFSSDNIFELILTYAMYLACIKDNRSQEGKGYLEFFEAQLNQLA